MKTIISLSFGRDSIPMTIELLEDKHPTIRPEEITEIVFADTGSEADETYLYKPYFEHWLFERYGRTVTTLSWQDNAELHHKTLFDYCNEEGQERIPSRIMKWCTDKAKIAPITRYIKAKYPGEEIRMLIGFRGEEAHRIDGGRNQCKGFTNQFPMGAMGLDTRDDCFAVFDRMGLKRAPHSACWFCPMRVIADFKEMAIAQPDRFESLISLESIVNVRRKARMEAQGKVFAPFTLKHKPLATWRAAVAV